METITKQDSLERLRNRMGEKEIENALISHIENVRWLTGFSGSFGMSIVTNHEHVFISDSRYREQAKEQVRNAEVVIFQSPRLAVEVLQEELEKRNIKHLGFEAEYVTVATYEQWKEKMPETEFLAVKELVDPLRMVKSAEEILKIRYACGVADACFEHISRLFQPGVTEYDIALEIEFFIRRQGDKNAFDPIVVSGERSSRPHGEPGEKKLAKGDFVTLDFGACHEGYCSDITRTIVIGEVSVRQREVYNAVLEAQLTAIDAMKPGVGAKEIDALARSVLAKYNLDSYFGHGLGHGLGRLVHDVGRMNATSTDVLEEGQVWTVEPGVYIEGFGGVRIEDDVLITRDGVEVLTKSPKELRVY